MSDELPDVIAGRYEIGPMIGRGATARVHRAVDRELGREVAVKVYDHHVAAAEQLRLARERTLLASVHHPRVVALFDSGTEGDRPYLVMQLVEGENIAERLLAGPFTAGEVSELAVRLAHALAHVHARRIVHRDLKPANVLLGPDGPLITDFGIAHALGSTRITGTGLVTGTAAYLAPEQVLGEQAGPPADVYALGLILLECLTAQREFPGTPVESAMARLHRAPRIPDGTPAALAHAVRRMTARDPADRPTADQLPGLVCEGSVSGVADWPVVGRLSGLVCEGSVAGVADRPVVDRLSGLVCEGSVTGVADWPTADRVSGLLRAESGPATAVAPAAPASGRRRRPVAAGVLAVAAVGVLAVLLIRPADPAASPAGQSEPAPPTTSAAVPSQVAVSPASAVVVASSHSAKPVSVGVVAAVPPKTGPAKPDGGPVKPGSGPAKPDDAHHPGAGKTVGQGGTPGKP